MMKNPLYDNKEMYLDYVKQIRKFYELKNDKAKSLEQFNKITSRYQKLVQEGIIAAQSS